MNCSEKTWDEDPRILIKNVLSPAKVEQVIVDEDEKAATVVVPDYQLSLAIGKEGQNVRLAARLCGWKIDIKSHSQYDAEEPYDYDDEEYEEDNIEYVDDGIEYVDDAESAEETAVSEGSIGETETDGSDRIEE